MNVLQDLARIHRVPRLTIVREVVTAACSDPPPPTEFVAATAPPPPGCYYLSRRVVYLPDSPSTGGRDAR